mgnify:CR=1 FL=1
MKNKLIILQVFVIVVLMCTSVYAAVETTLGVKISNSTLYRGDTFEGTLTLKDVKNNEKITGIEGYLQYDKNIIEKVTFDSIVKDENNKVKIGDETLTVEDLQKDISASGAFVGFNGEPSTGKGDAKILIDFNNAITKDTDLITIKFKIKSDAKIGELKDVIKFTGFTITTDSGKSDEIGINVNLAVKEKPTNNNNNQDQDKDKDNDKKEENKVDQNAVGKVNSNTNKTNNSVNNTNTSDNTVSGTKLPATGAKVFIIPVIVLIALAYISYNRYVRMRGI